MANELTESVALRYDDGGAQRLLFECYGKQITITGKQYVRQARFNVTQASEVAIPITGLASIGVAAFKNLDETNFIEIRTGSGGTKIIKILPGEAWPFRFGSGVTAPYAIADTADCEMEYVIFEQ